MKNYCLIENDPLFIAQRLKEVDKSYFILFNLKEKRYEVHSTQQFGGSFCFSVKDDVLDERAIFYALKTRKEKMDEIIKQMDAENDKLQKKQLHSAVEKVVEEIL